MLDFFLWWLAVSVLSLAVFPLSFRLFRRLPDRGYAASKPLSILLASYLLWILAAIGLLANDRASVFLIVLILIVFGSFLGGRQRSAIRQFFQTEKRYVATVEGIFLAIFAWFALLRASAPDIAATEKPFELAFLNGVSHSHFFPPADPWYSGHAISYYYFGFLNVSFLDKLTGVSNGIGFNLGTPLTAALAAAVVFSLVYALVRMLVRSDTGRRRAMLFGLVAVVLLLFVSNLEGVLELAAAHGLGPAGFYQRLGINGLPVLNSANGSALKTSSTWYPNDGWSFWWWWRATRMGSSWNIMEFPFFSFMLGDLHPHVLVIPYALLSLLFTWSLFAGDRTLDGNWWRREPLLFVVFAILLGALGLLNAWDQPTEFLVLAVVVALANARRLGIVRRDGDLHESEQSGVMAWNWETLRTTVLFVLPLLVASIVLYLPFWLVLQRPDITGIAPTLLTRAPDGSIRAAMATPPLHLLLFWGPLLWVCLAVLLVHARRSQALHYPARYFGWPLAATCVPFAAWLLVVAAELGVNGLVSELRARGSGLWTELILAILVFLALSALMREVLPLAARVKSPGRSDKAARPLPARIAGGAGPWLGERPLLFGLIALGIGLLFLLGAELFFVQEAEAPARANTVFKFWYQAWILLGIGDALGLAYVLRGFRPARFLRHPGRVVWAGVTAVILLAALIYPVTASASRANGFQGPLSLNGLSYWQRFDPADYAAAMWLSSHGKGKSPVVLEAEGGPLAGTYSPEGGRISELSGVPTVLGWSDHEWQERGKLAPVEARSQAIRSIYTTTDPNLAQQLLARYHIRYVVVGQLEREVYGAVGMAKFATMGAAVYTSPQVTIYDLETPIPLQASGG